MTLRQEMAAALGLVLLGAAVAQLTRGAVATLALPAVAGAGAVLLVRNRTRVLIGLALVLLAAGMIAAGWSPLRGAAVAAGALVASGGAMVTLRTRRWPQPRGRYDSPAPRADRGPRDTWDALDRGEDPAA